jgi:hypothetical protein
VVSDRDNIVSGVDWAVQTGDIDTAARVPAALGWHGALANRAGLSEAFIACIGMVGIEDHPSFPQAAGPAAYSLVLRGDPSAAIALGRRAVMAEGIGGPPAILARMALTVALLHVGEADQGVVVAEETVDAAAAWGDPWLRLVTEGSFIAMAHNQRYRSLEDLHELASDATERARVLGNPTAIAMTIFERGVVKSSDDPSAAIPDLDESLRAADVSGSADTVVIGAIGYLCRCYAAVGDEGQAAATVRRGVVVAREAGSHGVLAQVLDYGGQALITLGHDEEGAALLEAVARGRIARRALGGRLLEDRRASLELAYARLGEEGYATAQRLGAAFTPESAGTYALEVLERLQVTSA